MNSIQPWMRLKVNTDTFYLPDVDGSVYFRNNVSSFRMEGATVDAWIEKLLPVFDGQKTIGNVTDGLAAPYQERIYEIAEILYNNGFVRDVSMDKPHQLPNDVIQYFGPQIEFIDNLVASGAYRFQTYRNSKVAIIASGQTLVSLLSSFLESGLSTVNVIVTDEGNTNKARLQELLDSYNHLDTSMVLSDLSSSTIDAGALANHIQSMDAVVHVSLSANVDDVRKIESTCRNERTLYIPAIIVNHVGLIGPIILPDKSAVCFDSAWRRVHGTVFERDLNISEVTDTSLALLANVMTFEVFKSITGISSNPERRLYTLDVETLEGKWHTFLPNFGEGTMESLQQIPDLGTPLPTATNIENDVLSFFSQITDKTVGIFHVWDEGNLPQLPLSQCRVQPIHPASIGPATLLPESIHTGVTHEVARYEAGLYGIESYVRHLVECFTCEETIVGIGAGHTMTEAIGRGLTHFLWRELHQSITHQEPTVRVVELGEVEDEYCQFFLRSLRAAGIEPFVGRSGDIMGFPVTWVGINDGFVGGIGLTVSMAFQRVFEHALVLASQDQADLCNTDSQQPKHCVMVPSVHVDEDHKTRVNIASGSGYNETAVTSAVETLSQKGIQIHLWDLALEKFLQEGLGGVIGISVVQEGVN